ncbi:long-chain fatty acid--CoA ligase [Roseibium denhamense]|uniref:Fatty-acyl-CoA synthase n=1 Tax=Roseibium denhamense TaxID=76305 RepID=A0ABY1NHR8_9HYPH|nr:AMP-binding protein [Roseibium denhamense]MTI05047.1 long-chain fatty acid--CoA ligase [Roseibium denhamense]SMP10089.1 fatty-acyl-CoA synthase [Roseibium denhamense]
MKFLTDMAAKRAELAPERIAFIDHGTGLQYTFAEVNDRAVQLGNLLLQRGLAKGDRIAVLCHNHPDFFVLLFAAQKTGIVLVPLNWRQPLAELEPVLKSSKATLLFHDEPCCKLASGLVAQTGIDCLMLGADGKTGSILESQPAINDKAPIGDGRIDPDAPWYLLFTSGTTGQPKAVIQTAGMALANMINYTQATGLGTQEHGVNFLPLFHTAGINLPTLPIFLNGGCSTILRKFDPDTVLSLINDGKVTCFFGVPAIYQALALSQRIGETDFKTVRSLGCGGAPVPKHLLIDFQKRGVTICNGMGMTETGPTVFLMDKEKAAEKIGSVGKPQILTDVRLQDPAGRVVGGEGSGEIQFRGPNITPGYMDNPNATAASFTADGWLKSGDVGKRDADGYYYIIDRIKDMYISGGENVYPAEVEKVLVTHPAILEAVVIGVPDENWGEVGAAFIVPRPGSDLNTDELPDWCRQHLAPYKIPKSFTVDGEMPRTAAGKVRKNILKDAFLASTPVTSA